MGTNIVVVGAGYAGILTAKKLEKKLRKQKDITITVVDRNPYHTMLTELHEVAACRVEESAIRIELAKVFAGRRVNVALDTVEKIDFDQKEVVGKNTTYEYDYVVVASGSKPTYFGIEGAKEYTHTLWSYDDAVNLRDHIHQTFLKASKEPDLEKRRHLLTFYVVGAGFTGVEMMGELAEYVPILCEKHNIDRKEVTLVNVDAMSRTVPVLPEKLSNKVQRRLEKMGVRVQLNAKVKKITDHSIQFEVDGQIREESVHTVIWTAGIESSDIATESGKAIEAAQRGGRIETDPYLRAKGREDVFVAGDNLYYILEGEERPVPQMVENAEHSADTIAHNIISSINGKELEAYKPAFHGMMVCIGGRYGVAHVGFGKVMFGLPSFIAMFAKHFINIVYFVQVLGWNKIFTYLKHEIFTIRNRRSFVGGNFSNRTPSFLAVVLRVWLGFVWLYEATIKYLEGWLDFSGDPKLEGFFSGADSFYQSILYPGDAGSGATGAAADAASTASGAAAESTGVALFNIRFFNVFHLILVSGVALTPAMGLSDLAFKVNIPLMNWFIDTVILSSNGMQFFMQAFIVIMEFLVGLALMGGFFTTLFATISVILQLMFLTTTGWYLNTVWMFAAGIAVIFGGSTFGLDYWFMPWFKRQWKKIPFVKKWYLYND